MPCMKDVSDRERTIDELPQSAQGKTIMTTEPKFIPKNAAEISLAEDLPVKLRLIDCVGFLIDGVNGHLEDGKQRMVKTPWQEKEMPFAQAAQLGTEKVIREHGNDRASLSRRMVPLPRFHGKIMFRRRSVALRNSGK